MFRIQTWENLCMNKSIEIICNKKNQYPDYIYLLKSVMELRVFHNIK